MKKILKCSFIFVLIITLSLFNCITSFATQDIMQLEGPSVTFNEPDEHEITLHKDANGNYTGNISKGISSVSCVLSGYTGGISSLYEIYIRWSGISQISNIRANNLAITTASIPAKSFYNKSFFINANAQTSGYKPIGTCYIPAGTKTVRIKTTGLQCYFTSEYCWLSTGEINGTHSVN